MPASIWERAAERLGYALAAVVLGPYAAMERRHQRAMRTALVEFCADARPIKLPMQGNVLRRQVTLAGPRGDVAADIEVDRAAHQAHVAFGIERLPSYVTFTADKNLARLEPRYLRRGEPLAQLDAVRLDSDTLDAESANVLVAALARGHLGALEAVAVAVTPDSVRVRFVAPTTSEAWVGVTNGIFALVSALHGRWPPSYR